MLICNAAANQNSEAADSEDVIRFDQSLKELKELRSQLHCAADYCEKAFLNAKQKTIVMENTKEYICRAVVTVVDHLGSVSANLSGRMFYANAFSEAELRINTLKQRLLSCEQYAHKLALTRVRWHPHFPKYHQRYLSTPITNVERPDEDLRDSNSPASVKTTNKLEFDPQEVPLFLYTSCPKSVSTKRLSSAASAEGVLPVRDGFSILSKAPNPTFHFQMGTQKRGRNTLFRKSVQNSDILSFIRKTKRLT